MSIKAGNSTHLIWILFASFLGFSISFLFGNLTNLPIDVYYLIYFSLIITFFVLYISHTNFEYRKWFSRHLLIGIILGLIFAFIMAVNVFSMPETEELIGPYFYWTLLWRGLIYGAIDGLLLSSFPWIVTWRAFSVEKRSLWQKVIFSTLSLVFVIIITTAYHYGYSDFRGQKLMKANVGNTIITIPTLLSQNPISAPITHAGMHMSAVIHSPETDLFLPPHKTK